MQKKTKILATGHIGKKKFCDIFNMLIKGEGKIKDYWLSGLIKSYTHQTVLLLDQTDVRESQYPTSSLSENGN